MQGGNVARLNIEDKWWTDPRKQLLSRALGSEALATGVFFCAARLAQDYWKDEHGLIPKRIWDAVEHHQKLIDCGLAEIRPGGIYLFGSEECFRWIEEKREKKVEAGKKGGAKRSERAKRGPDGRFKNVQTETTHTPDTLQTEPDTSRPSYSYSISSSSLDSKESRERETAETVEKSSQESGTKITEGSLPERKTKIQSELKGAVNKAVDEWGITLRRWGFKRNPQSDEIEIARAIQRFGSEAVLDALIGKRFDRKTEKWNPADFCTAKHVLHPDNIDRFATYASQHSERNERSLVDADQAMSEFLSGRSSG